MSGVYSLLIVNVCLWFLCRLKKVCISFTALVLWAFRKPAFLLLGFRVSFFVFRA